MVIKIFVIAVLATAALALEENDSTGYTNCQKEGATLLSVDLEGCEVTPCTLVKGVEYKITVRAQADRVTAALPYVVSAYVLGSDLDILEGEACQYLTVGKCPTEVDKEFTFEKGLIISDRLPDLNTTITAKVYDEKANVALCASFKITTVTP